jgi:hypothetical protein
MSHFLRLAALIGLVAFAPACGGSGAVSHAESDGADPGAASPTETPSATASPEAASASASASPAASAGAAAGARPGDAPPTALEIAEKLRDEAALSRVTLHVVDDACLLVDRIPDAATRAMGRVELVDFAEGDVHTSAAVTEDDSSKSLAALRNFVAAFPKGHLFPITTVTYFDKQVWRAICVSPEPLLRGGVGFGRIRHKDGTYDEDQLRVGIPKASMATLRKLPPNTSRVVFMLDGEEVVVLDLLELRKLDQPAITLAKWSPN